MLRTSSYTIYVDLPDSREEMLLVHGYTGAYDRVSRRVAAYLRSLEPKRPPKPLYGEWKQEPTLAEAEVAEPPEETLHLLRQRGYLTTLDPGAEEEFFAQIALELHDRARNRPPSFVFMPTYDCNLRCAYCFQDHMRTDSDFRHLLHTMPEAMVDRIFSAIPEIESRHAGAADSRQPRDIGFFGGEPLLAANRPTVERILDRALDLGPTKF
ncbi:MAG: 4Fe-4S cluster-binding domain-containing protein, partial [Holophagales bacterium]|nr:4Fe-4S cluster-binding domain-containing protein [Holophagales bacterium]